VCEAGATFFFVARTNVVVHGDGNDGNRVVVTQHDAQTVCECKVVNRSWR